MDAGAAAGEDSSDEEDEEVEDDDEARAAERWARMRCVLLNKPKPYTARVLVHRA